MHRGNLGRIQAARERAERHIQINFDDAEDMDKTAEQEINKNYNNLVDRQSSLNKALDKVHDEQKQDKDKIENPKKVENNDEIVESADSFGSAADNKAGNGPKDPDEKKMKDPAKSKKVSVDHDDCGIEGEHDDIDERIVSDVIDPTSALIMVQGNFFLHLACCIMTFLIKFASTKMQCFKYDESLKTFSFRYEN